jgi:hypothetical protein
MKKIIYLIKGENNESYQDFKTSIFTLCYKMLNLETINTLKVVLTENKPPAISIIPFKKTKIAAISIQTTSNLENIELVHQKGFVGFFEVTEALPVAYDKNWDDETITPGVCLLTLFNQKKAIDYTTFLNRWHNSHTPLSLKIHPLTHYNRNVVDKNGKNNVEKWDGIVEEHTKTKADLLNPLKFFGGTLNMIPNMISVYTDTKSFLDYNTIETYLTAEYHLKS